MTHRNTSLAGGPPSPPRPAGPPAKNTQSGSRPAAAPPTSTAVAAGESPHPQNMGVRAAGGLECPDQSVRAGIGIAAWHAVDNGHAAAHHGLNWHALSCEELVVIAGRAMAEVYRHIDQERAA